MATDARPWYSKDTVAVVTGANKGIGLEVVRLLAEKGLTVVLTSRDQSRGEAALDGLKKKGLNSIVYHQLDTSDSKSIRDLVSWLKSEFGGFDILVNNAGLAPTAFNVEAAKTVFATNYFGVKEVTKALLPLLRSSPAGARIVTVTSRVGLYERLKLESLREKFRDEENYSEELADSLVAKYIDDMEAGRLEEEGWMPEITGGPYPESKMILDVYSNALAKELLKERSAGREIFLASFCPGVTLTDMLQKAIDGGFTVPAGFPVKTVEEGADTGVWLSLLPKEQWHDKHGKYFAERSEYLIGTKNPPF